MNVLAKIKHLPKRQQLLLGMFAVAIAIGIALFIWALATGRIKPFAAGITEITNTATVSYKDPSGVDHVSTSNTVRTALESDTQAPTAPAGLSGTAPSSNQVTLSWTASTDNVGVTGYNIYRNGTKLSGTASSTSFSDTGLNASTTYTYQVSAFDAAGNESTKSNQIQVTTPPSNQNVTINLHIELQGRQVTSEPDWSTSGTILQVCAVGQCPNWTTGLPAPVLEKRDISTDNSGNASFTLSLSNGNYDFRVKVRGYISKVISNQATSGTISLLYQDLRAGDIYNPEDNFVNGFDFGYLSSQWGSGTGTTADINKDTVVNGFDFGYLSSNWFNQGQ